MRLAFWRAVLRFVALMLFLMVGAGVSAAAWMPQGVRMKDEMARFCATFRVGHSISTAEISRRAGEHEYKTLGPFAVPARQGEAPLTSVTVYQFSWTGTRWSCTVHLQEGRATAVRFRTARLAD